jgi:hypothetical protein
MHKGYICRRVIANLTQMYIIAVIESCDGIPLANKLHVSISDLLLCHMARTLIKPKSALGA